MTYSRIAGFLSMAVLFALVLGVTFAERSFAQTTTTVEILATDLADDPDGDNAKDAQDKVNAKIAAATVTAGAVVTFPSGEFEDVGEILIVGKNGTAATTNPAAPAKHITFRGNNTVFTGKIMFNVQDSTYVTIEGFTFRDTKVPDRITVIGDLPADASDAEKDHLVIGSDVVATDAANNGDAASEMSGGIVENYRAHVGNEVGVIWLNPSVYSTTAACPASQYINNITIRGNRFENTSTHGISTKQMGSWIFGYDTDGGTAVTGIPIANYRDKCHSSKLVFSRNTFMGIGYNGDYFAGNTYRDGAGRVPGYKNWKGAINTGSRHVYDWTVSGNTVDGTTLGGLSVGAAFGTILIENNVVSNTGSGGIGVSQSSEPGDAAAAAAAKITIRNNRVTNSRNDAYFTNLFGVADPAWAGYLSIWDPGAGMLTAADYGPGMTDKAADALLKPRVFKLPKGHSRPYIGVGPGASRLLSSIYDEHATGYDSDGSRPDPEGTEGETGHSGNAPGVHGNLYSYPTIVRALKPTIGAGIGLTSITAKTIVVENNELTDNVVGLAVCPSYACYADGDFQTLLPVSGASSQTPAAGTLTVPTLTANRIYDNRKRTDMPREFVRADVVNALTETNTGTGSNVLVLKGNYLGASPEVRGAVNDDDLAMEDLNAGPRETVPPALPSTGGAMFTGTTMTLTYGEALDEESVPSAAAFTVTQMDSAGGLSGPITVSSVAVEGMSVTLTLAKAPGSGNSVTVSYDPAKAGSGEGIGPIQDEAGNAAAALSGQVVSMTPEPVDPGTEMPPTEMPPAAAGGDGGCALASGGSGIDLGMLLLTVVPFAFVLVRRAKEAV